MTFKTLLLMNTATLFISFVSLPIFSPPSLFCNDFLAVRFGFACKMTQRDGVRATKKLRRGEQVNRNWSFQPSLKLQNFWIDEHCVTDCFHCEHLPQREALKLFSFFFYLLFNSVCSGSSTLSHLRTKITTCPSVSVGFIRLLIRVEQQFM